MEEDILSLFYSSEFYDKWKQKLFKKVKDEIEEDSHKDYKEKVKQQFFDAKTKQFDINMRKYEEKTYVEKFINALIGVLNENSLWKDDSTIQYINSERYKTLEEVEPLLKKIYKEHFDKILSSFSFVTEAERIKVYRAISIDNLDRFLDLAKKGNFSYYGQGSGIGKYWTYKKTMAQPYWGDGKGKTVILTGIVNVDEIDIKQTIMANLDLEWYFEKEITLKEGSPIKIINIEYLENNKKESFPIDLILKA